MESTVEKNNGIWQLRLSGSLTIEQAESFQELLLQTLADAEEVVVDLSEISRVDLSCLQLLQAMETSCQKRHKVLTWQGRSALLDQVATEAGYQRIWQGCEG